MALSFGYHVIWRSDSHWAGLSADLVIEQVPMRNMKTTGGLIRGRGMAESQQNQWLLSMPAYAEVNSAIQEFTDTYFATSEQHKDVTPARQNKDEADKKTLLGFLQDRNPFEDDMSLRNIATCVAASKEVTANRAKGVGCKILGNMTAHNVVDPTFKKKEQVVTMSEKRSVQIDGEKVQVDPQLLFQHLVTAAGVEPDNIVDHFKYELCSHPSAMYEPNGLMRGR